jgi:starvation-inducible DNA-binding protein
MRRNRLHKFPGPLTVLLAKIFPSMSKPRAFIAYERPTFRDCHLLLAEHGDQLFAMTDEIAEHVREIGETTFRSIGHIARIKLVDDNDADYVTPVDMLSKLWEDDKVQCSWNCAFA